LSRAQEAGGVLPLVGKGIKGVTSGIFGMVKASVAFLATPIGLVLAAIGLVLGTVINYLKSTQAGIDAVTAVTRPLSAVFESLIGILQQVGEFLFKAFANPKKTITDVYNFVKDKVIKVFTGYFDILAGIATLDFDRAKKGLSDINDVAIEGINSIKNAAGAIGDTFAEAIKRGQKIDEIQKKLSKGEADFIDQQSRLKEELKEQNLIAEDQTRSLAEREAAASRSIQISKDINGLQKERIELERQLLVLNSQNNDTSDAQKAEIAQKLAEIRESNAQQLELETTQQNKLNSIRKEGAEKAATQRQKSLDEAAEKMKLELDLYLQNQDEKGKSLEQELQGLEILRDKSLAIAKAEFNATKKTENDKLAYLKSQNDIKKKFLEETSQAVEDYARAELELWKASHLSKIDSDKALTREIIDEEN
ncbi:MAG: hypothetical protein Q8P13_00095, partial [bacterium]|nr:hypothetical protein [bacterium]